jgi:CRISPR/Cas system-associated exonuclease Cas4 (RecB family)
MLHLYVTITFIPFIDKHNILGKADALLLREWGKQLIELKTIKNRDKAAREETTCFEDLISPKSDHLYQVNLYMDMADKLYGGVKNGSVIYGSKNNNRRKEFSVRPVQQIIQEMYFRADMVTEYLTQEKLPERRSDQNVEDCRWCPWAKLCTTEHTFKDVDRRKVE